MDARRFARTGMAVGACAAAGLAGLAATAGSSSASPASFGPRTVVFKAVTAQESYADRGPDGPSIGDRFTFADDLYYWDRDRRIGTDGGDCVVVRAERRKAASAAVQCVATLSMARGQITTQGLGRFLGDKEFTVAVTGGTGAFRGVSGTLTVRRLDAKNARLTLRLDDPWTDGVDGMDGVSVGGDGGHGG